MRSARGLSILMVVVVLAILMTALLAAMALTRVTNSSASVDDTRTRLAKAVTAIDQFAASQHRLPCPADPTLDTGVEALTAVGGATCNAVADEGTLPWKTLGLLHDDGYDAWGDKLSYRVYTGNKGSLVQPEGVNMTECDTNEPGSGNTSPGAGSAGGLCISSANPLLRSTSDTKFLQNKELNLSENGTNLSNVAYLVISHGATGYGAWTISGSRKSYSDVKGDELKNTSANGPFTIRAFSDVDVEANTNAHFDDLLAYRTLPDLVKRIGLQARDWPDDGVVGGTLLNAAALQAATGQSTLASGTSSVNFGAVTVTASSGDLTLITDASGNEGMGTAGIFGSFLNSFDGNWLGLQFGSDATKFAVTLGSFGIYSFFGTYADRVEFIFKDSNGVQVASVTKSGCNADGGLASFVLTAPAFRTVEVHPMTSLDTATNLHAFTFFTVAEVKACTSSASSCTTSMATVANTCP